MATLPHRTARHSLQRPVFAAPGGRLRAAPIVRGMGVPQFARVGSGNDYLCTREKSVRYDAFCDRIDQPLGRDVPNFSSTRPNT